MSGLGDKINDLKKNFLDNPALQQLDKKKIIGILFIALVLIYLDLAFLMSLQLKAIKNIGANFKKLNTEIAQFKREFSQSQHTQASSPMSKEIISEAELPLLLQDITDMANKNNVRILQLNPVREAARTKKGAPVTELTPNLLALDLICDYHSLGGFINDLENAPKFMAVEELRINSNSDSMFQQDVNLVIKTYVKK
jgi:Tfp pilus assembly protein PilO